MTLSDAAARADELAQAGSERELADLRAAWGDELEEAARSADFRERAVAFRAIGQFRWRAKEELLRRGLDDQSRGTPGWQLARRPAPTLQIGLDLHEPLLRRHVQRRARGLIQHAARRDAEADLRRLQRLHESSVKYRSRCGVRRLRFRGQTLAQNGDARIPAAELQGRPGRDLRPTAMLHDLLVAHILPPQRLVAPRGRRQGRKPLRHGSGRLRAPEFGGGVVLLGPHAPIVVDGPGIMVEAVLCGGVGDQGGAEPGIVCGEYFGPKTL